MSYEIYKILHIFSIILVFVSLGGMIADALAGNTKENSKVRKTLMIGHGVGMIILLVAGMGLLARSGAGWPGWIFGKIGLWVLLGGLIAMPYRLPHLARPLLFALPFLGAFGAWLAVMKPF